MWTMLVPAVVLLYYPAGRIMPADMKLRSYHQLNDPAVEHRRFWWRWQPVLWVDAVRIALGIWLVKFALAPVLGAGEAQVTLILGTLLLPGITLQMVTRRKDGAMFAPVGYALAALCVLLPPISALQVAVISIVALGAIRYFDAFFLGGGVASMALGLLPGAPKLSALLVAAVFILPVLLAAMLRCKLVLPVSSRAKVVHSEPLR
jgi:hypothetical protein